MKHSNSIWVIGLLACAGFINSAQATSMQETVSIHSESFDSFIIAREASEGPRGGDKERPGDRQRRGGKHGEGVERLTTAALDMGIIPREASSGGKGKDDPRPHR